MSDVTAMTLQPCGHVLGKGRRVSSLVCDVLLCLFNREGALTLHVMTKMHFLLRKILKYHEWSCQNVCDVLTFLLDNILIRFGNKL